MQVQQAPASGGPVGLRPSQPGRPPASKGAPIALWAAGAIAIVIAAVAWFVPMGSASSYGFKYACPSAADSLGGVARVADMSHSAQFTSLAAKELAGACPQTAVALGVGIVATIAGLVMLVVALVLTVKRTGSDPVQKRPWVAPGPGGGYRPGSAKPPSPPLPPMEG